MMAIAIRQLPPDWHTAILAIKLLSGYFVLLGLKDDKIFLRVGSSPLTLSDRKRRDLNALVSFGASFLLSAFIKFTHLAFLH